MEGYKPRVKGKGWRIPLKIYFFILSNLFFAPNTSILYSWPCQFSEPCPVETEPFKIYNIISISNPSVVDSLVF